MDLILIVLASLILFTVESSERRHTRDVADRSRTHHMARCALAKLGFGGHPDEGLPEDPGLCLAARTPGEAELPTSIGLRRSARKITRTRRKNFR